MDSITVKTSVGKKEFRQYLMWASFQSNIMSVLKIILISAALAAVLTFAIRKSWVFFLIWTAVIVVIYTAVIIILNEVQISRMDSIKNFAALGKEAEYVFGDKSFSADFSGKEYSYSKIRQLFSTKNLLVINYGDEMCFLIRKKDIEPGDLERITGTITKYREDRRQ